MKKREDELLDHNYDGIQEYDNDLPRWWVALFWTSSIVGIIYAFYFHNPGTPTPLETLAVEMKEVDAQKQVMALATAMNEPSNEELLKVVDDSARQALGKDIYVAKCMLCHGDKGQGLIGPNMTDDHWIHGGNPTDLRRVILEGVPAKGMLSWKPILKSEEIDSVIAFIWSLNGSNPPGAKAPEGELFKRAG
jgi:cytochrome c oxidase cbb3-type subunit 3